VHAWDPLTPIEEVMRALDDMVKSGKILYAGISDAPAWIVSQANTIANLRGWTEFTGLQIEYSLIERTSERELLPMASALDIGVTAWSPLGNGVLTGKYNKMRLKKPQQKEFTSTTVNGGEDGGSSGGGGERLNLFQSMSPDLIDILLTDRNIQITEVVKVANEIGRTPAQVALNWIRQYPPSPSLQQDPLLLSKQKNKIIPIIGSRKESQIIDNLQCLEFELSNEQLKRLNESSKIELGFPHDFLNSKMVHDIIYDNTTIYNHRK
jgi:aryl-alcohol dehydrogenase-like predicted oxidoreductase